MIGECQWTFYVDKPIWGFCKDGGNREENIFKKEHDAETDILHNVYIPTRELVIINMILVVVGKKEFKCTNDGLAVSIRRRSI